MSKHSTPSQTILNLARAVNQLAEARERFRVASMASEKIECEELAKRLLDEMEALTNPPESMSGEAKVIGRYSEEELNYLCICGHTQRVHLPLGKCRAYGGGNTNIQCACEGFLLP